MCQRNEWLDIETAPKDGSYILLGRGAINDDCPISTIGQWQEEVLDGQDYMGADAGFVDHEFSSFHPGRSFGTEKHQYKAVQPTHWAPMPSAPKDEVNTLLIREISRAEWHDKAWELFHTKKFNDVALCKVNIHTIRAVFDATYDALHPVPKDEVSE